ncbi:MAG: ABC transporter ATP-binding protein [Chloroflexota bacterium]|nr:ABC transporter ATP-binding protein [Chloroflexota bacterium]
MTHKVMGIKNLSVEYPTPGRTVYAVNDISLDIYPGEMLGLIGESGSGKTTVAMAILQLLQKPGRVTGGQILLNDETNLLQLSEREFRKLRWCEMALVSQGAMNSLNPTMRIKDQIADGIEAHEGRQDKEELKARIMKLLGMVGLPERVYDDFPHELSGGMKQRVGIAMAVSLSPTLVIADEPTSALDVISQRIVAQTLLDIKERLGISVLLIGHDIGLMAQLADRVAVMYDGHIVEVGPVDDVLVSPIHPYTQMLIESMPSISRRKPLRGIDESLRQKFAQHLQVPVQFYQVAPGHRVAKHA